jgi:hypothetical protein
MDASINPKSIIVGIDVGVETSQVSVSIDGKEPESFSLSPSKNAYLIPTAICVRTETRDWIFGEDAIRCRNRNAGQFVEKLCDIIDKGETINIFGSDYTGAELLEKFLRKIITTVRQRYLNAELKKIIVTVKNKTELMEQAVVRSFENIGYESKNLRVLSYLESFMYYAISQKKELWTNDVSLFDFDEEGLKYCVMTTSKKALPITVTVTGYDMSDELNSSMLFTMVESRLANTFKEIADRLVRRQILSTIFFTGVGFDGTWADDVIKSLCPGRRLFKGQNLYTKGAVYAGLVENNSNYKDFLFLTDEQIRYSISIRMFKDNRIGEYPMVAAGTDWRTLNAKTVGILDNSDEVFFTIFHTVRKETRHVVMNLRNIEPRENKTTRVAVNIKFLDRDTAVLTIRDLGFGEFFENTYRIWEKVINF